MPRNVGDGGHIARFGDLVTPCWCEQQAKPIPQEMIAKGVTWSCCFDCYIRYSDRQKALASAGDERGEVMQARGPRGGIGV